VDGFFSQRSSDRPDQGFERLRRVVRVVGPLAAAEARAGTGTGHRGGGLSTIDECDAVGAGA